MILTVDQLAQIVPNANILQENHLQIRSFPEEQRASAFLSHKHDETEYVKRVAYILKSLHADIFVDWRDNTMPAISSGDTAAKVRQMIDRYDKFILVASDGAMDSKWCNWELGYADARKFDAGKMALFPIAKNRDNWKGAEYMQLYPTIQYYDGTERYANGSSIQAGFYYQHKMTDGKFFIKPLTEWLVS